MITESQRHCHAERSPTDLTRDIVPQTTSSIQPCLPPVLVRTQLAKATSHVSP